MQDKEAEICTGAAQACAALARPALPARECCLGKSAAVSCAALDKSDLGVFSEALGHIAAEAALTLGISRREAEAYLAWYAEARLDAPGDDLARRARAGCPASIRVREGLDVWLDWRPHIRRLLCCPAPILARARRFAARFAIEPAQAARCALYLILYDDMAQAARCARAPASLARLMRAYGDAI